MKNTVRLWIQCALFIAFSFYLYSCTMAKTSSLITSLDAFSLVSPKPVVTVTFDLKGYGTIEGQCSSFVKSFQVTAELKSGSTSTWYALSSTEAPGAGETDPAVDGIAFDSDCSDSSFRVFFYRHNLDAWFSASSNGGTSNAQGSNNIRKFYIRGVFADGSFTNSYKVYDESENSNPKSLSIWKLSPGYKLIAQNQCTQFRLDLMNTTSATSVTVQESIAGTAAATTIYSASDCSGGSAIANASLSFAAGETNKTFYYKTTGSPGSTVALVAEIAGAASVVYSMKIKNVTDRFLNFIGTKAMVKDVCYPATLEHRNFNNVVSVTGANLSLTSDISFYTTPNCTGAPSTLLINIGQYAVNYYFKLKYRVGVSGSEFNPGENVDYLITTSDSAVENLDEDIHLSQSINTTVTALKVMSGPSTFMYGDCPRYELAPVNVDGMELPYTGTNASVVFSSDIGTIGGGTKADVTSNSGCSTMSAITIQTGNIRVPFYVSPHAFGNITLAPSVSGLSSQPLTVTVAPLLMGLKEQLYPSLLFPSTAAASTMSSPSQGSLRAVGYDPLATFSDNNIFEASMGSATSGSVIASQSVNNIAVSWQAVVPILDFNFHSGSVHAAQDSSSTNEAFLKMNQALGSWSTLANLSALASGGTYLNRKGILEELPAGTPRFDYDPNSCSGVGVSRSCTAVKGLLLEEGRSNYFPLSVNVGATAWSFLSGGFSLNTSAEYGPGGSSGVTQVTRSTTGSPWILGRDFSTPSLITSAGSYVFSVFIKNTGGLSYPYVAFEMGTTSAGCVRMRVKIDAANPTYADDTTFSCAGGGTQTSLASTDMGVQAYPEEWFRIWIKGSFQAGTSNYVRIYPGMGTLAATSNSATTGDFHLWGPQVEQGAFPTSYIPNSSASTRRDRMSDSVRITGLGFAGASGTWLVEFQPLEQAQKSVIMELADSISGLSKSLLFVDYSMSYPNLTFSMKGASVGSNYLTPTPKVHRASMSFNSMGQNVCIDDSCTSSSTVSADGLGTVNTMNLGQAYSPSQSTWAFAGHIRAVRLWTERLSTPALHSMSRVQQP